MIHVTIRRKHQRIYVFKVTGHALSAPYGEDLVCAGVSAIVTGAANAFDPKGIRIHLQEGKADFQVDDVENSHHQTILELMKIQLQTIVESNPKYIQMNEKED
jgi:hypothetical protein